MIRIKIFLKTRFPLFYNFIRDKLLHFYLSFREKKIKKLGEKTVRKVTIGGVNFPIILSKNNGFVDEEIFWKGCYEEEVLLAIQEHLQDGDTFVDIGANIGEHTLLAAHVSTSGKVIAFEPLPAIYNQLQESITLNNLTNIIVHNQACGDRVEEKTITINPLNVGGSSMVTTGETKNQVTISVIKGDSILLNEKSVDLIKIDTEGYEYEVLLGIEETIKKFQPKILLEFSPSFYNLHNETKSHGQKIFAFFEKHNYSVVGVDIQLPEKETTPESLENIIGGQANLLFTPKA